jgi:hypothetical protein
MAKAEEVQLGQCRLSETFLFTPISCYSNSGARESASAEAKKQIIGLGAL